MTEAIAFMSFEEFLENEAASPVRHDLVGGRLCVIAGGTERHDLTAQARASRSPNVTPAAGGGRPWVLATCG